MQIKSKIKSKSILPSIINKLKTLESKQVNVGFFNDTHSSGYATGDLATILHEGVISKDGETWKTPPRPFMFKSILFSVDDFRGNKDIEIEVRKYLFNKGGNVNNLMKYMGKIIETSIRRVFDNGADIPYNKNVGSASSLNGKIMANAPSTEQLKGFNHPLVNEGELKGSIKIKVVKK